MRLTCPCFSSECGLEDASIATRVQELMRFDCEHARRENAALCRTRGPGAGP